ASSSGAAGMGSSSGVAGIGSSSAAGCDPAAHGAPDSGRSRAMESASARRRGVCEIIGDTLGKIAHRGTAARNAASLGIGDDGPVTLRRQSRGRRVNAPHAAERRPCIRTSGPPGTAGRMRDDAAGLVPMASATGGVSCALNKAPATRCASGLRPARALHYNGGSLRRNRSMKQALRELLDRALEALRADGILPAVADLPAFAIERSRSREHGDFATNAALLLAKVARRKPREVAEAIVAALAPGADIARIEIAGPGFINFFLAPAAYAREVRAILDHAERYGRNDTGAGRTAGVEFVSANPTGPLHVGHGRAAAIGDCIARVLDASGWRVVREFYYNDAGAQIANLALSVQARCRGMTPDDPAWPEDGYRGDYIAEVARAYLAGETVHADGIDLVAKGDADDLDAIRRFAVAWLRSEQDRDLRAFGVAFDVYFLESSLYADGKVEDTVRELVAHGHTYEEGGALWLRTSDYGDDKDRVMRKSDASYTYFVPDIAYHRSKWQRGYERAITELGADHHGTLARVRAGLQALDAGIPKGWPEYVLHQMVTVMRGGEEVKISKRAGSYVTLRDLIDEAGSDA